MSERSPWAIVWPTPEPIMVRNFLNTGLDLMKEKIGALSQDPENPFSRVCAANSCISLEPVRGCPLGCAYCIAGNDCRNLLLSESEYHLPVSDVDIDRLLSRTPELLVPGRTLAEALVRHPAFLPHKTVLSVAAGSSEAFLPGCEQETWAIMEFMAEQGYRNPFWFVTKLGVPANLVDTWCERFRYLQRCGIPVLLSISDAGAPEWVEPYQQSRFRNLEQIRATGVHLSHHLRPIIAGINDAESTLKQALDRSRGLVESVCLGGLRLDTGVVLFWHHIAQRDLSAFATGAGKQLRTGIGALVERLLRECNSPVPVFERSSEAISYAFGLSDFNLYRYRPDDESFLSVPLAVQHALERERGIPFTSILAQCADSIGLHQLDFSTEGERVSVSQPLHYAEHRLLIHAIGHSGILH